MPTLFKTSVDVEALRIYLILPLYHEFVNSKNYENLHMPVLSALLRFKRLLKNVVLKWWAETDSDWFERLVLSFKDVAIYILKYKIFSRQDAANRESVILVIRV